MYILWLYQRNIKDSSKFEHVWTGLNNLFSNLSFLDSLRDSLRDRSFKITCPIKILISNFNYLSFFIFSRSKISSLPLFLLWFPQRSRNILEIQYVLDSNFLLSPLFKSLSILRLILYPERRGKNYNLILLSYPINNPTINLPSQWWNISRTVSHSKEITLTWLPLIYLKTWL